jgi:hypothetical protein
VTSGARFHPWRRLGALPHIDLSWRRTPGRLGETDGAQLIRLHPDQSQVQRRCTLAHELAHVELGHVGGASPVEERAARQLAARWLVDMEPLLDGLRWADDLATVADECWVDEETLMARLDGCRRRAETDPLTTDWD